MRRLAAASALFFLVSCTGSESPVSIPQPVIDQPLLLEPATGYPLTADRGLLARLGDAYGSLRAGAELAQVERSARELLAEEPSFHPASVLLAQVEFLRRADRQVLDLLSPVADELPDYLACQLLRGGAAERLGEIVVAYRAFRQVAAASVLAAERAEELRSRAVEIVFNRLDGELDRGQIEAAESHLELLEEWAREERITLEAKRRILVANGDLEGELEVVRRLVSGDYRDEAAEAPADDPLTPRHEPDPPRTGLPGSDLPGSGLPAAGGSATHGVPPTAADRELLERLGYLELEVGDIRAGLERFEQLSDQYPDDRGLRERLGRARFLWRLELLPPMVQELGRKAELDRADLATLLYWLVPQVRYTQLVDPPIATDILDHPRHDEILRVMNLDLMRVDETLHRFDPGAPATRAVVFASLLGLLELSEREFACQHGAEILSLAASSPLVCEMAARCRLIPEEVDCLPWAPISGSETLDFFRRCLDLLGSE